VPRILFLAESFHPVLGGGERHIRALGSSLVASGFGVTVVTRRGEPDWAPEEVLDGMRVVRVPPSGPGRTGKYAMVPAALWAVGKEAFDLLAVRGTRVLGLPGLLAGRARGRPVVLQAEINGELSGQAYTFGTPLEARPWSDLVGAAVRGRNLLLRDADAFVAMSVAIRDEFVAAGVPSERVHRIPHGIDTDRFRPAAAGEREELRRRFGWPPHADVLVYTGRLLRGKGLETLLEAFRGLSADEPQARLVFVGSGRGETLDVEAELRSDAAKAGLGHRIEFAGRVDDVESYLRAADVFVFPSRFEALGLSLIEAAACGLPAVGSRTGGIVDVIEDERSGLLVPPGDRASLERALRRLLSGPDERRAFGERGRAIAVSRFDARGSVAAYRALFTELVSRTAPACSPARAPRAGAAPLR
jgi:glycosyltransferase involved in cell wall biosynthesis